jgi:hypothetical protein
MSLHETPMIRRYWQRVGGTLVEEFPLVRRTATCGQRLADAVILPRHPTRIAKAAEVSLAGEDVIVVQAKTGRLGMYLMGQTFFSAQLVKRLRPASVRAVALCQEDDAVLRPLLEQYPGLTVVVMGTRPTAHGHLRSTPRSRHARQAAAAGKTPASPRGVNRPRRG